MAEAELTSEAAHAHVGRAAASLFEAHGRPVYSLCRFLLRSESEAEDAAQQVFLSAYQSLLSGHSPRDARAWLSAIARNECRRRARLAMRTPLPVPLDDQVDRADVEGEVERREEVAALGRAIHRLPSKQRDAIALRELCGLSYEEIAILLETTVVAVEALLVRARRRLELDEEAKRALAAAAVLPLGLHASLARALPSFVPGRRSFLHLPIHRALPHGFVSKPLALKAATITVSLTAAAASSGVFVAGLSRPSLDGHSRMETQRSLRIQSDSTGAEADPVTPNSNRLRTGVKAIRRGQHTFKTSAHPSESTPGSSNSDASKPASPPGADQTNAPSVDGGVPQDGDGADEGGLGSGQSLNDEVTVDAADGAEPTDGADPSSGGGTTGALSADQAPAGD